MENEGCWKGQPLIRILALTPPHNDCATALTAWKTSNNAAFLTIQNP